MALITSKPSIPVLQSDTFEIQRQKINNLAADITTKLDAPPASWIGYTYIKSIKFNYITAGGDLRLSYDRTDRREIGPGDPDRNRYVHIAYDLQYDLYREVVIGHDAPGVVFSFYVYNRPAQSIDWYLAGGSESDNYYYLGTNTVLAPGASAGAPAGGVAGNKFVVEFALIDGRIATHTYTIKGNSAYIKPKAVLITINAQLGSKGKPAVISRVGGVGTENYNAWINAGGHATDAIFQLDGITYS